MSSKKPKPIPNFETDEAAEAFVAEADLTEYDLSDMKRVHFVFAMNERASRGCRRRNDCTVTAIPIAILN